MRNKTVSIYAIIIAIYTAVSLLLGNLAFGMIQIRIAELLLVLCLYDKKFIIPVTLGCFVTNLIGIINGLNPLILDLIVGTLATLLSGLGVYKFRNIRFHDYPLLSLFIPVIINGVMVGLEMYMYFKINIFILFIYIGLGEFISVTILGLMLYRPFGKAIKPYLEWYNYIMNININELKDEIKAELESMNDNDALFIDKDGKASYAIMSIDRFDKVEELLQWLEATEVDGPKIEVIGQNEDISYEEYEKIKAVIMEAVDRTFKPKAEKLN